MGRAVKNKVIQESEESSRERKYFVTPGTSFQTQSDTNDYNSFDLSNDAYRRSTARIVIKKYAIK